MAMTKGLNGSNQVRNRIDKEWAYRSLNSANQQKLFQTTLNRALKDGEKNAGREISSFQQDIGQLQGSVDSSGSVDLAPRGGGASTSASVGMDGLSASALMKLNALVPALRNPRGGYPRSQSAVSGGDEDYQSAAGKAASFRSGAGAGRFGALSAKFESGESGLDAIGYDKNGGTSYGLYQISSKSGTMRQFINYLEDHAPDWAERLSSSGPANTGGRRGRMAAEWKEIAAEEPEIFEKLQHSFIQETHYDPAAEEIERRTGINIDKQPKALQEVLWSTSVQHGPKGAANLFCRAIDKGDYTEENLKPEALIESIYNMRGKQFGSSTSAVRASVRRRFSEEKEMAIAMLDDESAAVKAEA